MYVLGVESSCDETSVAIVKDGKEVLSNIVISQIDIHKEFGGVVPEVASRNHVLVISKCFELALKEASLTTNDIDLVAVTNGPGLIGALLVGVNAAKAFAFAHNIKLVNVHHIHGHIFANNIENEMIYPAIGLIVSGGHTMLIYMKSSSNIEILGETLDDAVGEAYDKVARVLGLGYPGGPKVDKLAALGNDTYELPRVYLEKDKFDFSFSGLKSAVINKIHNIKQRREDVNIEDMCTSFQESVLDVLLHKTTNALSKYKCKNLIVAGGVAANSGLRDRLSKLDNVKVSIPSHKYCTDNAAMIAVAGYFNYQNDKDDLANMELNGESTISMK